MSVAYLVIPVLNEAANLPRLLADLEGFAGELRGREYETHLVLVNDGSTDDTVAVAENAEKSYALTVLSHEVNQGPGKAFATGFAHLAGVLEEGDIVFTLEGDNTSRFDTAMRMLTRLREGYDVVLASPYAYGGGFSQTSWFRFLLSHVANSLLKGVIGIHGIHTMSSFFRLYTAAALRRLAEPFGPGILETDGFECMAELLYKMILLRLSISEVEMTLESDRRIGKSRMKVGRTIVRYLQLVTRRGRWNRLAGATPWSFARQS